MIKKLLLIVPAKVLLPVPLYLSLSSLPFCVLCFFITLLFPHLPFFYIHSPPSLQPTTPFLRSPISFSLLSLSSVSSLPSSKIEGMKKLIRRLSRVGDSSHYSLLLSESSAAKARRPRRAESFRAAAAKFRRSTAFPGVPEGHVPIYVGEEMERFVVSAELLNHPVFISLLNRSAQEYGYEQKGALRIPCHVLVFEKVLDALRLGEDGRDLHDLIAALSIDDSCF